MNTEVLIESGIQVITRLINRPSVEDLDNDLFFNKLKNTDIIEIKGTISSGVNVLLIKLIAKCILSLHYDGIGIDVLFINTDNQFQISHLYKIIKAQICNINGPVNVNHLVDEMLSNLKIINCYNHRQFFLTLNSLDNILLKYKKVGLVIIDSISAYYWQQKVELSYDSYLMKMLNIIKKKTIDFNVVVLYKKQFNFESKKKTIDWYEMRKLLSYEVCLINNQNSNEFLCNVKSRNDKKQLTYIINDNNFFWIK